MIYGQDHLKPLLKQFYDSAQTTGWIPSLLLWGPPGSGKTTTAKELASLANLPYFHLNAPNVDLKTIRDSFGQKDAPHLVCIDELQYATKRIQQTLLGPIEDGSIVLVATMSENPQYAVISSLLSRLHVLEYHRLSSADCEAIATDCKVDIPELVSLIGKLAKGDGRKAQLLAQLVVSNDVKTVDEFASLQNVSMLDLDPNGDHHYMLLSALHKSIRGSDIDAALLYLAAFINAGDILSPSRRLRIIASEDIGLADPLAALIVGQLIDNAQAVGLPEAAQILAQAVIYLASAPKSNSVPLAINAALEDAKLLDPAEIPTHIASHNPEQYRYPHDYPTHWVAQQYLPNKFVSHKYYQPGPWSSEHNRLTNIDRMKGTSS